MRLLRGRLHHGHASGKDKHAHEVQRGEEDDASSDDECDSQAQVPHESVAQGALPVNVATGRGRGSARPGNPKKTLREEELQRRPDRVAQLVNEGTGEQVRTNRSEAPTPSIDRPGASSPETSTNCINRVAQHRKPAPVAKTGGLQERILLPSAR